MLDFLPLTYYIEVVKKDAMESYWSFDNVLSTPFPRNVMSRSKFYKILLFLHCCRNTKYPSKGQPGYDLRRKLGKVLTILQEQFGYVWIPKQHPSIDEGMIPFNGQIHFNVYNSNKSDKYGMKSFMLCDSSSCYCSKFHLYVKKTKEDVISKYGKMYDLVMLILDGYKIYELMKKLQLVEPYDQEEVAPKNSLLQTSNKEVNIKLRHITIK